MKPSKTILPLILSALLITGCSNTENAGSTAGAKNAALTQGSESADLETTQPESDHAAECITPTVDSRKERYNFLNLSIGDSQKKVTKLYGKPEAVDYEVMGNYILTDQSLYAYMIYKDKVITTRKYFAEHYDEQNGVIEMDVFGGDYETSEGIHIGSSIDEVVEKYDIKEICDAEYRDSSRNVLKTILTRASHSGSGTIRHIYDYGEFEKIAYIVSGKKFEDHCNIPALIFLIHNDKVSHIIVMNTEQLTLY